MSDHLCQSRIFYRSQPDRLCDLPEGHDGMHDDGSVQWSNDLRLETA